MRDTTERPEAVEAGTALLTGVCRTTIVSETNRLIRNRTVYESMTRVGNPFGDGRASQRIRAVLERVKT